MNKEKLKTIILCAEIVIMCTFLLSTWSYILENNEKASDFFQKVFSVNLPYNAGNTVAAGNSFIKPVAAAIGYNGSLYGALRDEHEVMAIYERLNTVLSECIGSAGSAEEVSDDDFEKVLSGNIAYLFFDGKIPLCLLGNGLQDNQNNTDLVSCVILSADSEYVGIYYRLLKTGVCMLRKTAVKSRTLIPILADFNKNNAYFASENSSFMPETLLMKNGKHNLSRLISGTPDLSSGSSVISGILETLGFNPYTVRRYNESENVQVYVQELLTAKITGDGTVEFSSPHHIQPVKNKNADTGQGLIYAVEYAQSVVQKVYSLIGFGNRIYIKNVQYDRNKDNYKISFGCEAGGVPVLMADGQDFASITVSDYKIVSAHFTLKNYKLSQSYIAILPEKQLLAAYADKNEKCFAYACYMDNGGELVSPDWYLFDFDVSGDSE